ncbi:hypothetical protein PU629_03265 [Pullulanibacillus sp. KACC 23026]|uniref:DUF7713 domain-containing protein n=1 Tax=Pullulanibacillus sp. KACC 23026 TaxID=3028315 RepID=UPI0023B12DE6|nr:hypothetical protein [Pullulanibacillus sp. KACC 23026]WEG13401.1 hypothetical protein PU629_03265 [Pullulanibacillus sp. KACC 23026]
MEITPKKCVYTYEGEIDYDQDTDGSLPLIKIEDKSFSWKELGEYLMRYEGFKIKIEMIDE